MLTTQAGGHGKPTAIITTSQPGQTPSTLLGISSVQPQVRTFTLSLLSQLTDFCGIKKKCLIAIFATFIPHRLFLN